jgi:NitT/TauT family transport system substrate-binding protein
MEYVTFNKSTDAVPLVITGDLDVYAGSINAGILNILRQETNIRVVADKGHISPGDGCTYIGLLVRKDLYESGKITGPAGLKGQTIAATSSGTTGYLLSTYLAQAGLTFNDVVLNDIPTAGFLDAFANKSVAVIGAPELHLSRLINGGNAVLLAGAEHVVGAEQLGFIAFGKNLLVDHPDIGARFLAAYLKGVQQYNEGKTDRNLQIMADATGETIETLKASCWVPINSDGLIDFSGVAGFQQWSIAQGQLEAPVTEEQFFDPRFISAAQTLLNP